VIDYFAPNERSKIIDEVLPAVRTTGYWEGELDFHNFLTGAVIPVLYNIFPIRDEDGAIFAYGTVTRNLTESRIADERMHYVASIVGSSDDAIVSKDLDGIVTSWNAGAERIFGWRASEVIGRSITVVVPTDRLSEETAILERIRSGQRIEHFETVRQHKDGRTIVVSLTVSPVKNADGKIIGASKIARDVTERQRARQQIETLAREAEHRSKNLLQAVQAIVRLSTSPTSADLKVAIEGRLHALANVHSLFIGTRWVGAELSAIAEQELAPYSGRVRIDGARTLLTPDTAQAVAMVLHELATNAVKYGALSNGDGQIDLSWESPEGGPLTLRWHERGGPSVQPPPRRGFGSTVIEQMVRNLKGELSFDWRQTGLFCEISFKP
jgi:PAS domain S-box-containing protein